MSAVLNAKRAILDAFATRAALRGTQREIASPGKWQEPETIFIGRVRSTETGRALGIDRRREVFTVEIVVTVEQPGSDAAAVEARAWTLYGEIEEAIVADPSLAGTVLMAGFSGFTAEAYIGDETRTFEIVADLECTANK